MVPGADGIWAARAWRAIDHWRCAVAQDAGGDEPEDQVSRKLSRLCAFGVAGPRFGLLRVEGGEPIHVAGGAGGGKQAEAIICRGSETIRAGKIAEGAFANSSGDAR